MTLRSRQRPPIPPRHAVQVLDRVIDTAVGASVDPHTRIALTRQNLIETLDPSSDERPKLERDLDDLHRRGWVVPVNGTMHVTTDGLLASKHRARVEADLDELGVWKPTSFGLSALAFLCKLPGFVNGIEGLGGSKGFAVGSASGLLGLTAGGVALGYDRLRAQQVRQARWGAERASRDDLMFASRQYAIDRERFHKHLDRRLSPLAKLAIAVLVDDIPIKERRHWSVRIYSAKDVAEMVTHGRSDWQHKIPGVHRINPEKADFVHGVQKALDELVAADLAGNRGLGVEVRSHAFGYHDHIVDPDRSAGREPAGTTGPDL